VSRASAEPSTGQLLLAFATLYVVWGTTYLAIRFALFTWPPLLLASARFAAAGGGLYAFLRLRGVPAPDGRAWGGALIVGGLLLVIGNGLVCIAEQWVPSGTTALILAATPMWMTILPWAARRTLRPRPLVALGLLAGLAGVAVLMGGGGAVAAGVHGDRPPAAAPALLIIASLGWAVGSLWSRRLPLPASPLMATALEMLAAAPLLFVLAALHGELSSVSAAMGAPGPLASVAYLIVFGSIAGFGSYVWLLRHTNPTLASTNAFVNPLVAVFIGWALGNEALGPRLLLAAPLIILSVAAVVLGSAVRDRAR
jgi:drug/metabolite transporter (DMT)-like permease